MDESMITPSTWSQSSIEQRYNQWRKEDTKWTILKYYTPTTIIKRRLVCSEKSQASTNNLDSTKMKNIKRNPNHNNGPNAKVSSNLIPTHWEEIVKSTPMGPGIKLLNESSSSCHALSPWINGAVHQGTISPPTNLDDLEAAWYHFS